MLLGVLSQGNGQFDPNMYVFYPPRIHEPKNYNASVIECQNTCGDAYFTCLDGRCPDYDAASGSDDVKTLALTPGFRIEKVSPGFFSRFLYYLTFGLAGRIKAEDLSLEPASNINIRPQQVTQFVDYSIVHDIQCHDKCQKAFTTCWDACFCDAYPGAEECVPKMMVFPHKPAPMRVTGATGYPHAIIVTMRVTGATGYPQENLETTTYSFQWNNI